MKRRQSRRIGVGPVRAAAADVHVRLPRQVGQLMERPELSASRCARQLRLQLQVLAYNLANFLHRLTLPASVKHRSLTTLREKLVKIGAKVIHRARYTSFQLTEVAVRRHLYRTILRRIARLRQPAMPPPLT